MRTENSSFNPVTRDAVDQPFHASSSFSAISSQSAKSKGKGCPLATFKFSTNDVICSVPLSAPLVDSNAPLNPSHPPLMAVLRSEAAKANNPSGLHNHFSASSGYSKVFHLAAVRLQPPLSVSGVCFSSVSLYSGRYLEASNNKAIWNNPIAGDVISISGAFVLSELNTSSSSIDGVCAAGTRDGSLHLFSPASGVRLSPPFSLGMAVIALDATPVIQSQKCCYQACCHGKCTCSNQPLSVPKLGSNGNREFGAIRLLAVTADCELWVWRIDCCLPDGCRQPMIQCVVRHLSFIRNLNALYG